MNRILLILLFICTAGYCFSQEISVKSFKLLNTDLTANTAGTSEIDQNGETAALIKVVTTESGFSFDCGMLGIVKTKQTPGEIWVYIPRGAQKITIKHPQLGILRNYYFPLSIEGARTYEMVLTTGKVMTVVKESRKSQYVVFQLIPDNAVVELNGEMLQTNDGVATKMMKFGTYEYKIQAPNYLPTTGKVTIDDPKNKKMVSVSLQPNFSRITLNVGLDAEIWINGEKMGNSTWIGDLGAGTYEFEAKKENYRSTTMLKDIVVTAEPQIFTLEDPTPILGEADINSAPAMSDIFIDGREYGQTPNLVSNILIGSHQLRIAKEGYEPYNQEIVIEENKPFELLVQLSKLTDTEVETMRFANLLKTKSLKQTGKKTHDGGEYYGELKKGVPNGIGRAVYSSGTIYEGEYVNGKRQGYGIYKASSGERYEGDWINDQWHGKGIYVNVNGDRYEGYWVNGKKNGYGVMTYYSGDRYDGDWENDWYSGQGTLKTIKGDIYVGQWEGGRKNGKGVYTFKDGARYEGEFLNDKPDGEGSFEFASGDKYTGHFKNGKRDGEGTHIKRDGTVIKGQWKNDKFIGEAKSVDSDNITNSNIKIDRAEISKQAPADRKMKAVDAMVLQKLLETGADDVSETSLPIRYHKVKKGETLQSIARMHNTTIEKLCKMNSIGKNIQLKPGRILKYN